MTWSSGMTWGVKKVAGPIIPEFQTETDLPDRVRMFGHDHRKNGYSRINPLMRLDDQRAWLAKHNAIVHEFFFEDWRAIEAALEAAFQMGKMKSWHLIAYRYENVEVGSGIVGSSIYPDIRVRKLGMLVFSREKDWLMFKMCL